MRRLFLPKIRRGFGGGIVQVHTMLNTKKYEVDWRALEMNFPQTNHFPDPSAQWDYLVSIMGPQGSVDPDMWKFISGFRQLVKGGHRSVRDKVVTTAFVDFIVDQLIAETSVFGDYKYHDSGIGVGAEAVGDVGMGTAWGGARTVGTQVETDHDTYKSIATTTYNASKAITEHGLFNTAATVTLMDRTKFNAINVVDTNQIEFTFEISFAAGG